MQPASLDEGASDSVDQQTVQRAYMSIEGIGQEQEVEDEES